MEHFRVIFAFIQFFPIFFTERMITPPHKCLKENIKCQNLNQIICKLFETYLKYFHVIFSFIQFFSYYFFTKWMLSPCRKCWKGNIKLQNLKPMLCKLFVKNIWNTSILHFSSYSLLLIVYYHNYFIKNKEIVKCHKNWEHLLLLLF